MGGDALGNRPEAQCRYAVYGRPPVSPPPSLRARRAPRQRLRLLARPRGPSIARSTPSSGRGIYASAAGSEPTGSEALDLGAAQPVLCFKSYGAQSRRRRLWSDATREAVDTAEDARVRGQALDALGCTLLARSEITELPASTSRTPSRASKRR